jgi:hypothetical protein
MSSNQACFCGVPTEIACKCSSGLNYFCMTHFAEHYKGDPDNHIPIGLAQIRMMQDPTAKLRNLKLSKIETKLHEYQLQIDSHLSGLKALHISMKQSIDTIFQDYYNQYQVSLDNVKNMRTRIDSYKDKESQEAVQHIERYRMQKLKGVLPGYQDVSPVSISHIFKALASNLGLDLDERQSISNILESGTSNRDSERYSTQAEPLSFISSEEMSQIGDRRPLQPMPRGVIINEMSEFNLETYNSSDPHTKKRLIEEHIYQIILGFNNEPTAYIITSMLLRFENDLLLEFIANPNQLKEHVVKALEAMMKLGTPIQTTQ